MSGWKVPSCSLGPLQRACPTQAHWPGLAVDPLAQALVCSLVNEALDHGLSKHLRVSCLI